MAALEREDKMPVEEQLYAVETATGAEYQKKADAAGSRFASHC